MHFTAHNSDPVFSVHPHSSPLYKTAPMLLHILHYLPIRPILRLPVVCYARIVHAPQIMHYPAQSVHNQKRLNH